MLRREQQDESGGLLCDEMGLGKTMEVLGTIKNSKKSETLLLCPKAVIPQWLTAAKKSRMNCLFLDGETWHLHPPFCAGQAFLFIANYEKITRPNAFGRVWDRVVLDEAHKVKNKNGIFWNKINKLNRKTLWCVTATPIINDLKDIRNLFGLVGYDLQKLTNYDFLCKITSEACLHRSMDMMRTVLKELPARPHITKDLLDFRTEDEAEFYRGIQGNIMRRWRALASDNTLEKLALLMRLRQLSLHPQVYINSRRRASALYERKNWEEPSTKFVTLKNKLEEPGVEPARWIVFCQFHDEMDMLETYLSTSPAVGSVLMYHGGLSEKEKEKVLAQTNEPIKGKNQILLLQLQSGGVGLNLQHFSKIVFMSPWWTAAMMDQAIGRAVRIGQDKIVEVTLLVLKEEESMNIDIAMLEKAEGKRNILEKLFLNASQGFDSRPKLRIRIPPDDPEDTFF